jgi:hypothetical protein
VQASQTTYTTVSLVPMALNCRHVPEMTFEVRLETMSGAPGQQEGKNFLRRSNPDS